MCYAQGIFREGSDALCRALHRNPSLQTLTLSGNAIGEMGGMGVSAMLRHNTVLLKLRLSNTGVDDDGVVAIAQVGAFIVPHGTGVLLRHLRSRPCLGMKSDSSAVHDDSPMPFRVLWAMCPLYPAISVQGACIAKCSVQVHCKSQL